MVRRNYAKKRDDNEGEIVKALEGLGASVYRMDGCGAGFPDLLVGHQGRNLLIEVKRPDAYKRLGRHVHAKLGGLDPDQALWHARHEGQAAVATTVDEAIQIVLSRKASK